MSRLVSCGLEPRGRAREPGGEKSRQGEGMAWGNSIRVYLGLTLSLSFHCGPLFRAYDVSGSTNAPHTDKLTGKVSGWLVAELGVAHRSIKHLYPPNPSPSQAPSPCHHCLLKLLLMPFSKLRCYFVPSPYDLASSNRSSRGFSMVAFLGLLVTEPHEGPLPHT